MCLAATPRRQATPDAEGSDSRKRREHEGVQPVAGLRQVSLRSIRLLLSVVIRRLTSTTASFLRLRDGDRRDGGIGREAVAVRHTAEIGERPCLRGIRRERSAGRAGRHRTIRRLLEPLVRQALPLGGDAQRLRLVTLPVRRRLGLGRDDRGGGFRLRRAQDVVRIRKRRDERVIVSIVIARDERFRKNPARR